MIRLIFTITVLACSARPEKSDFKNQVEERLSQSENWEFDRIDNQTVFFKNEKSFKTNLFELKFIGLLNRASGAPYMILSGKSCDGCGQYESIYFHSHSDGSMKSVSEIERFSYPGRVLDFLTKEPLFESEFFYNLSHEYSNSVVWLQKSLKDNLLTESLYIVKPQGESLSKMQVTDQDTIAAFKKMLVQNEYSKLKGFDRTSEP